MNDFMWILLFAYLSIPLWDIAESFKRKGRG